MLLEGKASMFFSEEKNQKTFISALCWKIQLLAGKMP
jgi:hypothetical protein